MPTGPARRGLLTGVRSFPFRNYVPTKGRRSARLDPDPRPPADRDRGARRGRRRDRLLHRQPVPRRPALRQLPPHARLRAAELLAGRLPLPQQALQAPGAAQRSSATCFPSCDSVEVGRLRSMVGWNSIYRDSDRDYPTARVVRSGINIVDDLKEKSRSSSASTASTARAARRAARLPEQVRRPQGIEAEGDHADPAVRDALLVGDRRGAGRRNDRARARAVRGRDQLHGRGVA